MASAKPFYVFLICAALVVGFAAGIVFGGRGGRGACRLSEQDRAALRLVEELDRAEGAAEDAADSAEEEVIDAEIVDEEEAK